MCDCVRMNKGTEGNKGTDGKILQINKRTGPNKVLTGGKFDSKKKPTCTFIRDSRVGGY